MPLPFSLEFPPTLKQSTPLEKLLFSSLPPCSWPTSPASARAAAFKGLQTESSTGLAADSVATGGEGRVSQISKVPPHTSLRHPLTPLLQTHDTAIQGKAWAKIFNGQQQHVLQRAAVLPLHQAGLSFPSSKENWLKKPYKSHSDYETKYGDVRKCGMCHPATLALPPCAHTAMAPSLITR